MINILELRAEMVRKGYTQKRLAAELGTTEQRLARRLKNGTIGTDDVTKIIEILGIENPVPIFFAAE